MISRIGNKVLPKYSGIIKTHLSSYGEVSKVIRENAPAQDSSALLRLDKPRFTHENRFQMKCDTRWTHQTMFIVNVEVMTTNDGSDINFNIEPESFSKVMPYIWFGGVFFIGLIMLLAILASNEALWPLLGLIIMLIFGVFVCSPSAKMGHLVDIR